MRLQDIASWGVVRQEYVNGCSCWEGLQQGLLRTLQDQANKEIPVGGCHQYARSCVCHVSRGLLQLTALRRIAVPTQPFTACP